MLEPIVYVVASEWWLSVSTAIFFVEDEKEEMQTEIENGRQGLYKLQ